MDKQMIEEILEKVGTRYGMDVGGISYIVNAHKLAAYLQPKTPKNAVVLSKEEWDKLMGDTYTSKEVDEIVAYKERMKAVLMSIQPKWVAKIARGEKTIEVRKSCPKLEVPFKVYIFVTKKKQVVRLNGCDVTYGEGKVIGEFICDRIDEYICGIPPFYELSDGYNVAHVDLKKMCLGYDDLNVYGKGKPLYGWHIYGVKIYDKPKGLGEFRKSFFLDNRPMKDWCHNHCEICDEENCKYDLRIKRPPQSWCYVEELQNG